MKPNLKEFLDMAEFSTGVPVVDVPQEDLLLVGGDFSGIQKYLYQIASTHASRSLKGRSFYLRLLSDSIVRLLLDSLGLTKSSIVYDSGGSFYLTAPNTEEIKRKVEETALFVERSLFDCHGTSLFLSLDYVQLPSDAIAHRNGKDLRQVWTELFNRRNEQKYHKFSRLASAEPSRFFEPSMHGGTFMRDSITGEELTETAKPDADNLCLSPITRMQIEIGKALQKSDTMLVVSCPIAQWSSLPHISPGNLGYTYYFCMKNEVSALVEKAKDITVEEIAIKGSVKRVSTFEELAEGDSFNRLGVLRMDVDNLGLLFQTGIPTEAATLERYRLLSHKFDYFFTDYLYEIQQEVALDSSLVIYAGGDDVFIVGAWDHTIALAKRIREDFRHYTKDDPRFSISGGIAILPPKYPIMKGGEESAEEEHNAKEHTIVCADGRVLAKNSISFMDTPLNWDEEFPVVEQLKNDILGLLDMSVMPKSFLGKVMSHAANAGIKNHKVTNYKTFWMLTYDLSRMKESAKNQDFKNLIGMCIQEVCKGGSKLNGTSLTTNYHPLELWQFACRWAELEYRTRYKS